MQYFPNYVRLIWSSTFMRFYMFVHSLFVHLSVFLDSRSNCSTGFANIYYSETWTCDFVNNVLCQTLFMFTCWFTCFAIFPAACSISGWGKYSWWRSAIHKMNFNIVDSWSTYHRKGTSFKFSINVGKFHIDIFSFVIHTWFIACCVSYYSPNKPSRISIVHEQCKDLVKRFFTMSRVRRASNGPSGFTHKNDPLRCYWPMTIPRRDAFAVNGFDIKCSWERFSCGIIRYQSV